MLNKLIGLFLVTLCLGFFIGCGAARTQVSGKVTFEDGSPVTKGNVRAMSEDGIQVTGGIGADGTYSLNEVKLGDGVPSGKQFKVWLVNTNDRKQLPGQMDPAMGQVMPGAFEDVPLVHSDFTSPNTTKLTLDTQGEAMTFDITVKKP